MNPPFLPPARLLFLPASLLPGAQLHIVRGGAHDFAQHFAGIVAPLIDAHLAAA